MLNFLKKQKPEPEPTKNLNQQFEPYFKQALASHKYTKFYPKTWPLLLDFFLNKAELGQSYYNLAVNLKGLGIVPNHIVDELVKYVINFSSNANNLKDWQQSGVETLKVYSADDELVCKACKPWNNQIVDSKSAKMGKTIPPYPFCQNPDGCRCYHRPNKIAGIT